MPLTEIIELPRKIGKRFCIPVTTTEKKHIQPESVLFATATKFEKNLAISVAIAMISQHCGSTRVIENIIL